MKAVEKDRERVVQQDRDERLAIKAVLEHLKNKIGGSLAEEGSDVTSERLSKSQEVRHLPCEELERLAKVDAQTEERRGEFQILRKILDLGQSLVEDFSGEKDSTVASLRHDIGEMRQDAKGIQADISAGTPLKEYERVVRENEALRQYLQGLQVEHQNTKRRLLLKQRERLERLEADAEIADEA